MEHRVRIETERLLIRPLQASDASPLAGMWSNPDVTRHMGGPRNFDEIREGFEAEARTGSHAAIDFWPVVEKASGRGIGQCGLLKKTVDRHDEIELVYVLDPSAWGRG